MADKRMTDEPGKEAVDVSRRKVGALVLGALGATALSGCAKDAEGQEQEVTGQTLNALSGGRFVEFDTIDGGGPPGATLKKTRGTAANEVAVALGYRAPGDGGEGIFHWDAASTQPGNGGTIIQVTGVATGRWKRLYTGPVSIQWFGAQRYPVDSSAAIQATIEAVHAAGGGMVYFPVGIWLIASGLLAYADTGLLGATSPMGCLLIRSSFFREKRRYRSPPHVLAA